MKFYSIVDAVHLQIYIVSFEESLFQKFQSYFGEYIFTQVYETVLLHNTDKYSTVWQFFVLKHGCWPS